MKRTIYTLCTGGVLVASMLLSNTTATAATADVKGVRITSTVQQVKAADLHEVALQLQDAVERPATVDGNELLVTLQTTSSTGEFFAEKDAVKATTKLSILPGAASRAFYYKDTTPGEHTLTITIEDSRMERITATYIAKVITNIPTAEPRALLVGDSYEYTKQGPARCAVRGSILDIPSAAVVRLVAVDMQGKERFVLPIDPQVQGDVRDIVDISDMLEAIPSGRYMLSLVVLQSDADAADIIIKTAPVPLVVYDSVATTVPNPTPSPVPRGQSEPSVGYVSQLPLETLKPVTDEVVLSTDFSVPYTLRKSVESRRSAVVAARRSGGDGEAVAVKPSAEKQPANTPKEQAVNTDVMEAVKLALPEKKTVDNTTPDAAKIATLKLLGIEWYWWGGASVLGVVWFSARRLFK